MTEREMLELAAKAAGVEGNYFESEAGICIHTGIYRPGLDYYWNPLISDSEAMRLAVKLRLCIEFGYCLDDAPVVRCGRECEREDWGEYPAFPDRYAETRRAIVRAAAEIGRAMP